MLLQLSRAPGHLDLELCGKAHVASATAACAASMPMRSRSVSRNQRRTVDIGVEVALRTLCCAISGATSASVGVRHHFRGRSEGLRVRRRASARRRDRLQQRPGVFTSGNEQHGLASCDVPAREAARRRDNSVISSTRNSCRSVALQFVEAHPGTRRAARTVRADLLRQRMRRAPLGGEPFSSRA